jgi:uncharacterized membrane-anchored protein
MVNFLAQLDANVVLRPTSSWLSIVSEEAAGTTIVDSLLLL